VTNRIEEMATILLADFDTATRFELLLQYVEGILMIRFFGSH
jgi:hypothetical protein